MVLKDILAIGGESGLFKFIAQGNNAIIVEHLETKKRTAAHGTAKVSSLEDIAIFTDEEEVSLSEVFNTIYDKESGGACLDHKSGPEELKAYFAEILPDYDRDRVYTSDIKKMIQWYNILHSLEMLVREDPESEEEAGEESKKEPDTPKSDDTEKMPGEEQKKKPEKDSK
jgi:hypothetical protein